MVDCMLETLLEIDSRKSSSSPPKNLNAKQEEGNRQPFLPHRQLYSDHVTSSSRRTEEPQVHTTDSDSDSDSNRTVFPQNRPPHQQQHVIDNRMTSTANSLDMQTDEPSNISALEELISKKRKLSNRKYKSNLRVTFESTDHHSEEDQHSLKAKRKSPSPPFHSRPAHQSSDFEQQIRMNQELNRIIANKNHEPLGGSRGELSSTFAHSRSGQRPVHVEDARGYYRRGEPPQFWHSYGYYPRSQPHRLVSSQPVVPLNDYQQRDRHVSNDMNDYVVHQLALRNQQLCWDPAGGAML